MIFTSSDKDIQRLNPGSQADHQKKTSTPGIVDEINPYTMFFVCKLLFFAAVFGHPGLNAE